MIKLTILVLAFWAGLYYEISEPKIQKIEIELSEDFHEDFDSTYYYYGCQYNTFKINHKCNGK